MLSAHLVVTGKTRLLGEIDIQGAKNAALPILCATVLVKGSVELHNVPMISDVEVSLEILRNLGAKVKVEGKGTVIVDATNITNDTVPSELVSKLRASFWFLGSLLGRLGSARVGEPGGCKIGDRKVDMHLSGLEAIGANIQIDKDGNIYASAADGIKGGTYELYSRSVGATINILLGAVISKGTSVIKNVATEPEIVDLIKMLSVCGAKISLRGTTMVVEGVGELTSANHRVLSDRIVAGTYIAGVAITRGEAVIYGPDADAMRPIVKPFIEMGMRIEQEGSILVVRGGSLKPVEVITLPHPGFPTDVQAQLVAATCFANGISTVKETIFKNRDKYAEELNKMGANITIKKDFENTNHTTFIVNPVKELHGGQTVSATDLRAGAALVLAALAAEGKTHVYGYEFIERGYENLAQDLNVLGANVKLVLDSEDKCSKVAV